MQIGECGGGRNRLLRGEGARVRSGSGWRVGAGGKVGPGSPRYALRPGRCGRGAPRRDEGEERAPGMVRWNARPRAIGCDSGGGNGLGWPSPLRVARHEHILAVLVVASCERSAPRNTVGVMGVGPGPPFFVCSDQIGADDTRPCG